VNTKISNERGARRAFSTGALLHNPKTITHTEARASRQSFGTILLVDWVRKQDSTLMNTDEQDEHG